MLPQGKAQRGLYCKQQRLGHERAAEAFCEIGRLDGFAQGPAGAVGKMLVRLNEARAEGGIGLEGPSAHAGPLGAVARIDEGDRNTIADRGTGNDPWPLYGFATRGQRPEAILELGPIPVEDGGPLAETLPLMPNCGG